MNFWSTDLQGSSLKVLCWKACSKWWFGNLPETDGWGREGALGLDFSVDDLEGPSPTYFFLKVKNGTRMGVSRWAQKPPTTENQAKLHRSGEKWKWSAKMSRARGEWSYLGAISLGERREELRRRRVSARASACNGKRKDREELRGIWSRCWYDRTAIQSGEILTDQGTSWSVREYPDRSVDRSGNLLIGPWTDQDPRVPE